MYLGIFITEWSRKERDTVSGGNNEYITQLIVRKIIMGPDSIKRRRPTNIGNAIVVYPHDGIPILLKVANLYLING